VSRYGSAAAKLPEAKWLRILKLRSSQVRETIADVTTDATIVLQENQDRKHQLRKRR
jgi:hypothetical protein